MGRRPVKLLYNNFLHQTTSQKNFSAFLIFLMNILTCTQR